MSAAPMRQRNLPLRKAAGIAWRNIRVRIGRSSFVLGGILLAVGFLAYILTSEGILRYAELNGSSDLLAAMRKAGVLDAADAADRTIQTWWMAGVSLLLAFVGILNSMVMSVAERTREIGTMKCLGALDSFILKAYLLESLFLGSVASLAGVALGILLGYAEAALGFGEDVFAVIPFAKLVEVAALVFVSGMALTVFAAIYPASRAARMRPVDAMRTEI